MVTAWKKKKKKGKITKFKDAGSNHRNEREGHQQLGMYQQGIKEKENKIKTIGTERSENIDTLHIYKNS